MHILSHDSLGAEDLRTIFLQALNLKERKAHGGAWPKTLEGKSMASLFFEPSLRTRFSFELAMRHLGGEVISSEHAGVFSSFAKGESLEDTIRVVGDYYPDVIVLRHPEDGAALRAAHMTTVPLINGGDGKNEHPTQAYIDCFTIWEMVQANRFGRRPLLLNIVFWGDNTHSRVVSSVIALLAKQGPRLGLHIEEITFVGIEAYGEPRRETVEIMRAAGISWKAKTVEDIDDDLAPYLEDADVVYVTRSQHERHEGHAPVKSTFVFDPEYLGVLPAPSIIMHPLPRDRDDGELPTRIDADPRAWYFKQSQNGLFVRMALLEWLLLHER